MNDRDRPTRVFARKRELERLIDCLPVQDGRITQVLTSRCTMVAWVVKPRRRVLQYLAEMTAKRRDADRRWKELSKHQNESDQPPVSFELKDHDRPAAFPASQLASIAKFLRERRRAKCECDDTDKWTLKIDYATDSRVVLFNEGCETCNHTESTSISLDELKQVVEHVVAAESGSEPPNR